MSVDVPRSLVGRLLSGALVLLRVRLLHTRSADKHLAPQQELAVHNSADLCTPQTLTALNICFQENFASCPKRLCVVGDPVHW